MHISDLVFLHGALFLSCARRVSSLRVDPQENGVKQWYDSLADDHYIEFTTPSDQAAPHSEEGRMRQSIKNRSVVVSRWTGRLGNNLYQIVYAIFTAKLSRTEYVTPPVRGRILTKGQLYELFDLPRVLRIEPDDEFRARATCSSRNDEYYRVLCTGATRADYTKVLREYILPHLKVEAREACNKEASKSARELVLHLRSGDLLTDEFLYRPLKKASLAPCSFFDVLINQDPGFQQVRIITETVHHGGQKTHPCLQYIAERNPNVTVQSDSLAADACALMYADHLGLGAYSTFSIALSWFNPRPVTMYDPFGKCRRAGHPICQNGIKVSYCIPGIRSVRTGKEKFDWMLGYNGSLIRKDGEQCLE